MTAMPTHAHTSSKRSRCATLITLAMATLALTACDRAQTNYPASTPDEALDSAQQMIATGDAGRLTDLVYADTPEMRSFLNQIGSTLASLQRLGDAVEQRFPEELTAFRTEAEQAAAEGKTNPLFARLLSSRRGNGSNPGFGISQINREGLTIDTGPSSDTPTRRSTRPSNPLAPRQSESLRRIVNGIIKQLLADPYRWLEEGRDNLDTIYIADDRVALTWKERPILPPFGLSMIEEEGRWFLVPPTAHPGISMIMPRNKDEWFGMPRNKDEWFVWGSMAKTLERVVVDLETEVRAGRVRNMTDLADTAAEKVAIPAMLVFFAYGNLVEQRKADAAGPTNASEENQVATQNHGPTDDPPGTPEHQQTTDRPKQTETENPPGPPGP